MCSWDFNSFTSATIYMLQKTACMNTALFTLFPSSGPSQARPWSTFCKAWRCPPLLGAISCKMLGGYGWNWILEQSPRNLSGTGHVSSLGPMCQLKYLCGNCVSIIWENLTCLVWVLRCLLEVGVTKQPKAKDKPEPPKKKAGQAEWLADFIAHIKQVDSECN